MFLQNLEVLFRYGFVPRKPRLWFRVFKGYFQAFLGKQPLHYIDFVTDYRCNLACEHCFATTLVDHKKVKMTINDYRRVAKEAISLGVIHFSFQGGEPLLDKRLPEIIRAFRPQENFISITTNGFLLTRKRLLELKKLGVDKISLSLDSGLAKEHNQFRGVPGSFERAWKGMRLALENGFRVTINTTVSHQKLNTPGIKKLLNWAIENRVIINPIFACPVGRWSENLEVLMTSEDRQTIDRWRQGSAYVRRDMDSNWLQFGCGAVKEVLYITPYGDVMPCPFLHISLGNLREESLKKIRERGLRLKVFQKYHQECLASENTRFIKQYLKAIKGKKLPAKIDQVRKYLND